jgi:histidinol-phosphate aminotransferase
MIAAKEGLKPENVFVCEGSTELLRLAGMIFGGGKELVAGLPTFTSMLQYAARSGGTVKWVNLDADKRLDLEGMEARVGENTGAVYVCNPNNPTGTVVDTAQLRAFIGSVAPRALVLVDEAYIDLVDDPAATTVVDEVKAGANVLIARTFSKIHGIAGLRVGYGLAKPDIIRKLEERRISVPNRMGLKAAIASYDDSEFLAHSRKMVRASVAYTTDFFKALKRPHTPTQANFMIFDAGMSSVEFATTLRAKFILVNPLFEPYDTWVRVTMGRIEHMEAFAAAARDILKEA